MKYKKSEYERFVEKVAKELPEKYKEMGRIAYELGKIRRRAFDRMVIDVITGKRREE